MFFNLYLWQHTLHAGVLFCSFVIQSYDFEKCPCWSHICVFYSFYCSVILSDATIYPFTFGCVFRLLQTLFHCSGIFLWTFVYSCLCSRVGPSLRGASGSGVGSLRVFCAPWKACPQSPFLQHAGENTSPPCPFQEAIQCLVSKIWNMVLSFLSSR